MIITVLAMMSCELSVFAIFTNLQFLVGMGLFFRLSPFTLDPGAGDEFRRSWIA